MDITKDSHSIYTDIHIRIYTDYSDVHTDTSPRICLITDDNINYGQFLRAIVHITTKISTK